MSMAFLDIITFNHFPGIMHSGYPIMGTLGDSKGMVGDRAFKQVWIECHEFGHNHQHKSYTIGRTAQSGANVWAYHVHLEVK